MKENLDGLIDHRNQELWNRLNESQTINIELVNTGEYGCFSKGKISTVYVLKNNLNPESFTHELLHVYLRQKKVFLGSHLKLSLWNNALLNKVFSGRLLEHISNVTDHPKMLPLFLKMGYPRDRFIADYYEHKCPEILLKKIKQKFKSWFSYNAQIVDLYIGKIFAIKCCPNESIDYSNCLAELREIDKQLFQINLDFLEEWLTYDVEKEYSPLDDNYIDIANRYISQMETWTKNKRIK